MKLTRSAGLALVCGIVLALAPTAFAQTPAQANYPGTGAGQVSAVQASSQPSGTESSEGTSGTSATTSQSSGTLPFTGLDVGVVLAVSIALLGTGFAVRRSARPNDN